MILSFEIRFIEQEFYNKLVDLGVDKSSALEIIAKTNFKDSGYICREATLDKVFADYRSSGHLLINEDFLVKKLKMHGLSCLQRYEAELGISTHLKSDDFGY